MIDKSPTGNRAYFTICDFCGEYENLPTAESFLFARNALSDKGWNFELENERWISCCPECNEFNKGRIKNKPESFRHLNDGWNGEGSKAVSKKTIQRAQLIECLLSSWNFDHVACRPTNDGGIQFRISAKSRSATIEIDPTKFDFLVLRDDTKLCWDDKLFREEVIPYNQLNDLFIWVLKVHPKDDFLDALAYGQSSRKETMPNQIKSTWNIILTNRECPYFEHGKYIFDVKNNRCTQNPALYSRCNEKRCPLKIEEKEE